MASPPPLPRRRSFGCFLTTVLALSMLVNVILCGVAFWPSSDDEEKVREKHLYGPKTASDKVAVVHADGALVEGLDAHILRQIQTAARDEHVKAVVLRVNSPGGTIGSSEDIHLELTRLKSGKHPRFPDAKRKPLIASMGSIAASGGYYIAMPADKVLAERNTITGSIGVYAALPNVSQLAKDYGVKLELIKAGGIKGAGSPLHEMTPQERQPWQDMVDQSYEQFLDVVVAGRPKLKKEQMRTEIVSRKTVPLYDEKGNPLKDKAGKAQTVEVTRYRADGGSFTASEAKEHGLIDDFGQLEDAVSQVATSAGLSNYRVVEYERPPSLLSLIGLKSPQPPDLAQVANGLTPRLWYMTPQAELTGILAASASR